MRGDFPIASFRPDHTFSKYRSILSNIFRDRYNSTNWWLFQRCMWNICTMYNCWTWNKDKRYKLLASPLDTVKYRIVLAARSVITANLTCMQTKLLKWAAFWSRKEQIWDKARIRSVITANGLRADQKNKDPKWTRKWSRAAQCCAGEKFISSNCHVLFCPFHHSVHHLTTTYIYLQ